MYKYTRDADWVKLNSIRFNDLSKWVNLFDTSEEIGKLKKTKDNDGVDEKSGVKLEKELYNKFCEYGYQDSTFLLPNSGFASPYPGDMIFRMNLIDVKGLIPKKQHGNIQ